MRVINIYKYTSENGVIITPINLNIGNPTITYRLAADSGKILTDGKTRTHVVEVKENEISLWREEDKTEEEKAQEFVLEVDESEATPLEDDNEDYKKMLDIITGEEDEVS